ncbi:unnamed protein product [Victoria cruziana]
MADSMAMRPRKRRRLLFMFCAFLLTRFESSMADGCDEKKMQKQVLVDFTGIQTIRSQKVPSICESAEWGLLQFFLVHLCLALSICWGGRILKLRDLV